MNTKLIGIRDFRQNISDYADKARQGNSRFIVMNRNSPLFEIKPYSKNADISDIFNDIQTARDDIKKGRLYSQDEIIKKFAK